MTEYLTAYQLFLLSVLVLWPVVIFGMLFLMNRLENYVNKANAKTPEEAGLEPVTGRRDDREITIRFGDQVIGESGAPNEEAAPTG